MGSQKPVTNLNLVINFRCLSASVESHSMHIIIVMGFFLFIFNTCKRGKLQYCFFTGNKVVLLNVIFPSF